MLIRGLGVLTLPIMALTLGLLHHQSNSLARRSPLLASDLLCT
jgi:hypothetical protein